MTRLGLTLSLAAATLLAGAALAQEAPAAPEAEEEVSVEESAILPSADDHEASRAPTMELDCENNPEDCIEPLTTQSEGPEMFAPDGSGTSAEETSEGAPVTAAP